MNKYRTAVVTLSDKGYSHQREDASGPLIAGTLEETGKFQIFTEVLLPDDFEQLKKTLISLCDENGMDLVLTTGGTGLSPRDITPEATLAVATRNVPGIAEYLRMRSFETTPKAMLSRAVSVQRNQTLIVNLPGSPKAVKEQLSFLLPALEHGLDILLGRDSECAGR